jgi:DNA-binding transcriptional ArsR family regulator
VAKRDQQQKAGRDPIDLLKHPTRRRILRYLHRCNEPQSPSEIATELGDPVSQIDYHLKTLQSYEITRKAQPSPEIDIDMYESAVRDNAEVLALLRATEIADESASRSAA